MVTCKCVFLDGKEVDITVEKEAKGSDLFESVCKYLGVSYRDPFGIVFRGGVGPSPYNWWIRPEKTLKAQIPGKCKVWEFAFIVKFYPKTLAGMDEDASRFHIIMQIRQDLLTGRLKCPAQTMAHLCSYWLQAQYGDWCSRHVDLQLADAFRYVQKGEEVESKIMGKSDIAFEEQMMQIHQAHKGMSSRDADFRFIKLAASLPDYGIHYYPAFAPAPPRQPTQQSGGKLLSLSRDSKATSQKLTIGIGPIGIHEYRKKGNDVVYTWKSMRAVSFKQNRIVLRMQGAMRSNLSQEEQKPADVKTQKNIAKEYFLADMYQTKIVWQVIIEYHMFFRMAAQKGLKGEERKRLVSSLKIKRTIPLVGEKKAEASPLYPPQRGMSRSKSQMKQQPATTSPKRSASVPVRKKGGQRPSSPLPLPQKEQLRRKSSDRGSMEIPPLPLSDDGIEDLEPSEPPSSQRSGAHKPDEKRTALLSPASYASTPMSGTFHFPPRPRYHPSSVSVASTSGEEILEVISNGTDNTEDLCCPSMLKNTFSYSRDQELDGIGQTSRGRSLTPSLRNTPKSSARTTNELLNTTPKKVGGERSATPSPNRDEPDAGPIVIPAEILIADLKETKRLRAHGGYQSSSSSDFPMELDYIHKKHRSYYEKDAALMDLYDREFEKQSTTLPLTERRAQSMYSLRTKSKERDRLSRRERSTSPKRGRHTSPLQRRALEGAATDQQHSRSEKRDYSERAQSESTLAHRENRFQTLPRTARNPVQTAGAPIAKRRSHSQNFEQQTPRGRQRDSAKIAM